MKRTWYVFVIVLTLLIGNAFGYIVATGSVDQSTIVVDEDNLREIMVTGLGSMSSDSTLARITIGVQSEAGTATEAVKENAEKMTNVINSLINLNINEDYIETQYYQISPLMNYETKPPRIVGYRVVNTIIVEVHDLSMIGRVIDGSVNSGANEIRGLTFGIAEEEMQSQRLEALQRAVVDARDKVEIIASTLNVELLGVFKVTENVVFYPPQRIDVGEYMTIETPILPGVFQITATVRVSYLIS